MVSDRNAAVASFAVGIPVGRVFAADQLADQLDGSSSDVPKPLATPVIEDGETNFHPVEQSEHLLLVEDPSLYIADDVSDLPPRL